MEFVLKNLDKNWNFENILQNEFIVNKDNLFLQEYQKHIAKYKIDNRFSSILLSPNTKWGKKHFERK